MVRWLGLEPKRRVLYMLIETGQQECRTESDKRDAILQRVREKKRNDETRKSAATSQVYKTRGCIERR